MTDEEPEKLRSWTREDWTPECGKNAAHPNARFTAPISQCPIVDAAWDDPRGVPISAILFGGRRSSLIPLVTESFNWRNGVFMGSIMASEMTAAAAGKVGELRRDPFAMLPFCGYNMGDYFAHWLSIEGKEGARLPKIYYVNWFRKDDEGKFLWPGYGENSRVLKWIYERIEGIADAAVTPIGYVPAKQALEMSGLPVSADDVEELLRVDPEQWQSEVIRIKEHFSKFGERLPSELWDELHELEKRLNTV